MLLNKKLGFGVAIACITTFGFQSHAIEVNYFIQADLYMVDEVNPGNNYVSYKSCAMYPEATYCEPILEGMYFKVSDVQERQSPELAQAIGAGLVIPATVIVGSYFTGAIIALKSVKLGTSMVNALMVVGPISSLGGGIVYVKALDAIEKVSRGLSVRAQYNDWEITRDHYLMENKVFETQNPKKVKRLIDSFEVVLSKIENGYLLSDLESIYAQ